MKKDWYEKEKLIDPSDEKIYRFLKKGQMTLLFFVDYYLLEEEEN